MRSGTDLRTTMDQLGGHHHAGEPLVGFAWQVRQAFVQQYGEAGAAWADRLFLAQVALLPPDILDFAERVIVAENTTPRDANAPPPIPGMVERWAATHGLRAAGATPDAQGLSTSNARVP